MLAGGRYAVAASRGGGVFTVPVRLHLGILAALFIVTIAVGFQLDKLELAHGSNGTVAGVSYTDAHARFFANDLLTIISAILAIAILVLALSRRGWRAFGIGVGAWVVALVLVGGLLPEIVQQFVVAPNELVQERPYIANNMNMTRLAFGIDQWEDGGCSAGMRR